MRAKRVRNSVEAMAAFVEFTGYEAGQALGRAKNLAQRRQVAIELVNTLGFFAPVLPDEQLDRDIFALARDLAEDLGIDVPWKHRLPVSA